MTLTRAAFLAAILLMSFTVCTIPARSGLAQEETDESQIRKVLRDSQFIEMLTIYTHPKTFDKTLLDKYWVPADRGGDAVEKVQASVRRLLDKGWHYGDDSENEQFEIRSLQILSSGDEAEVRTRERWYMPMVDEAGNRVKERNPVLEFPVRYRLRKIDGRWLVQWSSGPYRED